MPESNARYVALSLESVILPMCQALCIRAGTLSVAFVIVPPLPNIVPEA